MNDKKIKILVLYNEAHPEFYQKTTKPAPELDFKLYFEVETLTPMEEYEIMVKKLKRVGFDAHSLNIKDDLLVFLNEINNQIKISKIKINQIKIEKRKPAPI